MEIKLKSGTLAVFGVAFLGILSLYFFYDPSNFNFFPKCPFHSLTGLYCPGCGSQRAIHDILRGNIVDGLSHNFVLLILVAVLVYDLSIKLVSIISGKPIYNYLHNSKTTFIILILFVLFWIFRNINRYPFSILAP